MITALAGLIKAARGGLVVEEDLIAALKSGRVAAVGPPGKIRLLTRGTRF
jgi:hypothetical protein